MNKTWTDNSWAKNGKLATWPSWKKLKRIGVNKIINIVLSVIETSNALHFSFTNIIISKRAKLIDRIICICPVGVLIRIFKYVRSHIPIRPECKTTVRIKKPNVLIKPNPAPIVIQKWFKYRNQQVHYYYTVVFLVWFHIWNWTI